jgi:hypothetical protein
MIQLTQQSDNTFYITSDVRKTASQYYLMKFTSEVSNYEYAVFPSVVLDTPRSLKFELYVSIEDSNPLNANVALPLTGTYQYTIYTVATQSLTASNITLVDEGFAFLAEGTCVEDTVYVYASSNEGATASVYMGYTCSIGSTVSYDMTLSTRISGSEKYLWKFTSEYNNETYIAIAGSTVSNDRYVNLYVSNVNGTADPLASQISISVPGYYTLDTYIAATASLTASRTLIDTRTIQIEDSCEEPTYVYVSDNEGATATVYGATCSYTEFVELDLTLDSRKGATQSYMFTLTSDLTNVSSSLFPTLLSSNDRYVSLGFTNSNIITAAPLSGIQEIGPAGYYLLDTYVADSLSLTASKTLLDSRYIQLTTCSEDTVYTYVSGNEGATASVYLSEVCSDCLIWDVTPEYWDLCVSEWQNCN